jgi:hypothetical protein
MSAATTPSSAATGSSARRDRVAAAGMPPYSALRHAEESNRTRIVATLKRAGAKN